jgi:hypothetical protein
MVILLGFLGFWVRSVVVICGEVMVKCVVNPDGGMTLFRG